MKTCTKCKIEKELIDFGKHKLGKNGLYPSCKECNKKYYQNNKEYFKEYNKNWSKENKEKVKLNYQKWYDNNKEYHINYKNDNRDYINNYMNEYNKERRKNDEIFKYKLSIRAIISKAFKYGNNKIDKTIGCTIEEFKIHIKSKFKDGMTLDNYGEWHFDHIIPLATAQTKEQIIKLCHYTNLQPLWAEENFAKGDKIIP